MANGERCITCGHQETSHLYGEADTCDAFISEIKHHEDCPVIDCNGDCEGTMGARDAEAVRSANHLSHTWYLDGPNLVLMDIGT